MWINDVKNLLTINGFLIAILQRIMQLQMPFAVGKQGFTCSFVINLII